MRESGKLRHDKRKRQLEHYVNTVRFTFVSRLIDVLFIRINFGTFFSLMVSTV